MRSFKSAMVGVSFLLCGWASAVPLKIATVSPLTGGLTSSGTELKRGAELSVKNHLADFASLGYELSLASYDDQGSPSAAAPLAQTIAADRSILGVVGAYNSSVSNVLGEAFAPSKLAVISISTNDKLTKNGWSHFNRVVAPDGAQSVAAAKYITGLVGMAAASKSAYVISDNTTYGNGLATSVITLLKTAGVPVAGYSGTSTPSETSRIVRLVRASGANVVYYSGTDDGGARLTQAFLDAKLVINLIGSDGFDTPGFIRQIKGLAANITFTTVFGPVKLFSNGTGFNTLYRAAYNAPASGIAAYSYDATEAMLTGLKSAAVAAKGVPTRQAVSSAVRKVNLAACFATEQSQCQTVTGALSFSASGERNKSAVLVLKYDNLLQSQLIKFQAISATDLK